MSEKVISVVGLGYIGLPTAIYFASRGYKVFGFDKDPKIVEKTNLSNAIFLNRTFQRL